MFKRKLFKILKKLSVTEKQAFREALGIVPENVSETAENKKENETMEDTEKKVTEETKTEEVKDDASKTTGTAESATETKADDKTDDKAAEDKTAEEVKDTASEEMSTDTTVTETESAGNGVRVEDLVTKDEVHELLAAINAKLDAFVKENADLKAENERIRKKYEEGDFGSAAPKGVNTDNSDANETFESYSKRFM